MTCIKLVKTELQMTDENYISLTTPKLTEGSHTGHEYHCEKTFLVKHKCDQSCESATFLFTS